MSQKELKLDKETIKVEICNLIDSFDSDRVENFVFGLGDKISFARTWKTNDYHFLKEETINIANDIEKYH